MDWKKILHSRGARVTVCVFLILAILVGLLAPGLKPQTAELENPIQDEQMQDITTLTVGENTNNQTQKENQEDESTEQENQETQPQTIEKPEPNPDLESDTPDTGDGDEGQEDGLQGEEGGEEEDLDLGMVMTWYKYGTQPKTIVCGPSGTVSKTLNTAQLVENELKYEFFVTGEEAQNVKITAIYVKEGDGPNREISEKGKELISLPDANTERDYTFAVDAHLKKRDSQGQVVEQDMTFTFVLHCHYSLDIEMELEWERKNETTGRIVCTANETAARTIESNQLTDHVFSYKPNLVGALAEKAQIVNAQYTTESGVTGTLEAEGGTLIFQTGEDGKEERYYLTFEVQVTDTEGDVQTVIFRYLIAFVDTLDIELKFVWLEKGITRRTMICQPNDKVSTEVKRNQLSAGAVKYEMELLGADAKSARILNISYDSEGAGNGKIDQNGSLPFILPDGYTSNTYTISMILIAQGQQIRFDIVMKLSMDVSLEMSYTVNEDGNPVDRTVICENGKTKTADVIYDDQLSGGQLSYTMKLAGSEGNSIEITSVTCYQSGNGRITMLESRGAIPLLLKNGKSGENAFTVTAKDANETTYEFKINIPYKHRGENSIKITTNMAEGQIVINETKTNVNVYAWSEDEAGNVVDYIPANGVDTKLIVTLDGEVLNYVSSSGSASEYIIYPANPVTGDTNTHILHIYAEDSFGNYGELTVTLKGQRNQAGQKKGNATIYIDMTALGMGVVDSVKYEVLADEPISYAVAKAVMGIDTGDPFGAAKETLGWPGTYTGTFDLGFFLEGLTVGLPANTLEGGSWNEYGSTEAEVLKSIDNRFGAGTGLATLWRCIYRNGLNKSTGSGLTYNDFDYTSGSGWLFALDGSYYPGLSMSEYSLEDGDVLTLRYTLAYGWDVGGGTPGYGNTVGYCVSAVNGTFNINHQMEQVENADGSFSYVCHCCGLVEGCMHAHTIYQDLEDGTHVKYCEDCRTTVGDAEEHTWNSFDENHVCAYCEVEEAHNWKEVAGSNTATCISGGTRMLYCTVCDMDKQEETPAAGHALNNRWNHTASEHYQRCSACNEIITESSGAHDYVYDANDDDWYCKVCDAGHDWDYCGNSGLVVQSATCTKMESHCDECGMRFVREGSFEEYHSFTDGICNHCGAADPSVTPDPPEDTEPENPGEGDTGGENTGEETPAAQSEETQAEQNVEEQI